MALVNADFVLDALGIHWVVKDFSHLRKIWLLSLVLYDYIVRLPSQLHISTAILIVNVLGGDSAGEVDPCFWLCRHGGNRSHRCD